MTRFLLTNRMANPVLRRLLRARPGASLGRSLAVLRYSGRRSHQPHELVVQYGRDGNTVWIVPGHPEAKQWWRNFRSPSDAELWIAGEHRRGRAVVVDGDGEPEQAAVGLRAYLAAQPRARRAVNAGDPHGVILVRVDLHE